MKKELEQYKEDFETKKYENEAMKIQVINLDKELNNLKKELKNSKYNDRFFQFERIKEGLRKNIKPMTFLFKLNRDVKNSKPKVEVVINRSRHGTMIEATLDILAIQLGVSAKKKEHLEISFNVSKK